jgi:hypothetical protein
MSAYSLNIGSALFSEESSPIVELRAAYIQPENQRILIWCGCLEIGEALLLVDMWMQCKLICALCACIHALSRASHRPRGAHGF